MNIVECVWCGAAVIDAAKHTKWHQEQGHKLATWDAEPLAEHDRDELCYFGWCDEFATWRKNECRYCDQHVHEGSGNLD